MAFGDNLWPTNEVLGGAGSVDRPYPSYTAVLKTGSKATWQGVIAAGAVTADCHWIEVEVVDTMANATDTSAVLDIGVDPAGGTSYAVAIADLLVGHADDWHSNNGVGGSIRYHLPLKVASGSSVAIRGQTVTGADKNAGVLVRMRGNVTGTTYVPATCTTHGITGTAGTSITPGSDAWGSWTSVGSATAADYQALVLGVQPVAGTTINRNLLQFQMGWSSTVKTGIVWVHTSTLEAMNLVSLPHYVLVPSGSQLQVRAAANSGGTIDNPRVAIYGLSAT